jgi:hypothetical protein
MLKYNLKTINGYQTLTQLTPAQIIFLIEVIILILWLKSRRKKDGKDMKLCFYGFLLGQIYLLWEVWNISQTGKPLPGSVEQKMLMGRIVLGASMGGLFTIIELFYLSFARVAKKK